MHIKKYFKPMSRTDTVLNIIIIIILIIELLMVIFPNFAKIVGIWGISTIILFISIIAGYLVSRLIIIRAEKKVKIKKLRKIPYRPLEFLFFLFIFIATIFVTFAMRYSDFQTFSDIQYYISYWGASMFFYYSAIHVGLAHYVRGIHS